MRYGGLWDRRVICRLDLPRAPAQTSNTCYGVKLWYLQHKCCGLKRESERNSLAEPETWFWLSNEDSCINLWHMHTRPIASLSLCNVATEDGCDVGFTGKRCENAKTIRTEKKQLYFWKQPELACFFPPSSFSGRISPTSPTFLCEKNSWGQWNCRHFVPRLFTTFL